MEKLSNNFIFLFSDIQVFNVWEPNNSLPGVSRRWSVDCYKTVIVKIFWLAVKFGSPVHHGPPYSCHFLLFLYHFIGSIGIYTATLIIKS